MTARHVRAFVLLSMALLAVTVLAWQWNRLRSGSLWPLALLAPLFAPLPGILRARRYTCAWASFIAIAYIALGLTEVVASPSARALPAAMLFVAFALFVALVAFIRLTRARSPGE